MARILIVEDDAGLLKALTQHLTRAKHQVTTAVNGVEALRLADDACSFDLVITDLIMPEKEGLETIIELRQKFPALKIIAMSGGGLMSPGQSLAMAAHLGAIQTLAKPFSAPQLLAAVAGVLSQPEPPSVVP